MPLRRLTQRVFLALLLIVLSAPWSGVLAQDAAAPGEPGYMAAKVDLLLSSPALGSTSDQMYFLLLFMWADSLVRAGELIQDESLESDPTLQAQLIAETGVWESLYRTATALPPVSSPEIAPMQRDTNEALRIAVDSGTDLRDYVMTGNVDSLYRAIPKMEQMNTIIEPWLYAFDGVPN